jgi:phosphoribosylglycinamide formyltransferase-1
MEKRASQSGVMIHLVTKELDKGPPITFCTFPIRDPLIDPLWKMLAEKLKSKSVHQIMKEEGQHNQLFKEIRRRGVERELPLIVQTLKIFSEGKIRIKDKEILVNNKVQSNPYCLTEQIEAFIKD